MRLLQHLLLGALTLASVASCGNDNGPSSATTTPSSSAITQVLPIATDPSELFVIDIQGGSPQLISSGPTLAAPTWSSSGQLAYFTQKGASSELYVDAPATEKAALRVEVEGSIGDTSWSKDGRSVAMISQSANGSVTTILDVATGTLTEPHRSPDTVNFIGWLSDDRLLVAVGAGQQKSIVDLNVATRASRVLVEIAVSEASRGQPSISADGKRLAFVSLGSAADPDCEYGRGGIEVLDLVTGFQESASPQMCGIMDVAWSPDGSRIAFSVIDLARQDGGVYVADTVTKEVRRISASSSLDGELEWAVDGASVLSRRYPCWGCDAGTLSVVRIPVDASAERVEAEGVSAGTAIAPDGRSVAYVIDGALRLANGAEGVDLVAADSDWDISPVVWSKDSQQIAYVRHHSQGERQFELSVDGSDFGRLPTPLQQKPAAAFTFPSPDASRIVAIEPADGADSTGSVSVTDRDGSNRREVDIASASSAIWAPDSSRFLVDGIQALGSNSVAGVFLVSADGKDVRRLSLQTLSGGIAWSPDGRRIAITTGALVLFDLDEDRLDTIPGVTAVSQMSWSGDAGHLAFSASGYGGNSDIFVIATDGSGLRQLTTAPSPDFNPSVSPDGRFVAFSRSDPSGVDVILWDDQSSTELKLADGDNSGGRGLAWSPDGKHLAFATGGELGSGMFVATAQDWVMVQLVVTQASVGAIVWLTNERLRFTTFIGGI